MISSPFVYAQDSTTQKLDDVTTSLDNIKSSIDDSNYTNLVLISISLSVAIGSALFAGIQSGLLRKQTSLTEKEQNLRLRPWIGRESRSDNIQIKHPEVISPPSQLYPQGLSDPPAILIHYTNTGSLPALEIKTYSCLNPGTPQQNEFSRMGNPEHTFALAPGERATSRIILTQNQYQTALNGQLFFGLKIEYSDINGNSGLYEILGLYDRGWDNFIKITIE